MFRRIENGRPQTTKSALIRLIRLFHAWDLFPFLTPSKRDNPTCAGCHAIMDPIGLSLETFDGVGRIRQLGESSGPIDTSGALPDGTPTFADGVRAARICDAVVASAAAGGTWVEVAG